MRTKKNTKKSQECLRDKDMFLGNHKKKRKKERIVRVMIEKV